MPQPALAVLLALLLTPGSTDARQVDPAPNPTSDRPASVTLAGIVSIQPSSDRLASGPYLDHSLGGVVAGVSAGLSTHNRRGVLFGAEVSTTLAMSALQTGRLVPGDQPVLTEHRDTFISFLSGFRNATGSGAVEYKGGVSLVLGQSWRNGEPLDHDIAGALVLTGGCDGELRLSHSVALIPSARYFYVLRGGENYYLGLGNHVVRVGLGIRFALR